jgi:RNA polymerase sigma-70 factor (ECF subfamily)
MKPDMPSSNAPVDGEMSDLELVKRCQAGDTRAFDALVTKYRNRIYSMAYHIIQNETEAWDISQEAFIKAWRAMGSFKSDATFYTWLYRITHNVCYDWMRKKKFESDGEFDDSEKEHRVAAGAEAVPRGAPRPDQAMKNAELKVQLDWAISQLSADHRQIILLKEMDGLSYQEIADVMKCSLGTVMSRLFYARKKLQELLKETYENAA